MGWFGNLLKKLDKKTSGLSYADLMNGRTPIFTQFGTNIYASDVVQQAITCITLEMKKLRPMHILQKGSDPVPMYGKIQKMLNEPNPYMTTSDFLEKITWLLFLNYNVFIIPVYRRWKDKNGKEKREYEGLYPITPTQVDFYENDGGELFVNFHFADGTEYMVDYNDVIHIRHRYAVNQYMGGNEQGQPDNGALLKTLEINHQLLQGVASAMKSSMTVNAVVKYNTMLNKEETKEAIVELENKLRKSESGILPLDLKAEYTPIKKEVKIVDADTLKFIDEKILRQFGVPIPILTGDYTKEQYEAFYQKTLEPLIISFTQAFTRVLFTDKEKTLGNEIKFYPKELIFMSTDQTLEMIRLLGDSGALFENEKRVALGLQPLEELKGVRMQSLNYMNVEFAGRYQAEKYGTKGEEEDENENES
jgi:HK97 family phage portal protein